MLIPLGGFLIDLLVNLDLQFTVTQIKITFCSFKNVHNIIDNRTCYMVHLGVKNKCSSLSTMR